MKGWWVPGFALAVLLGVCSGPSSAEPISAKAQRTVRDELSGILAALKGMDGWSAPNAPSFYNQANLYEYIDSRCDLYFSYSFGQLASQELVSSTDAELAVVVDLYDMAAPDNAFGVYSAGRTPTANFVDIGAQGVWVPSELRFWKDRYFCLLTATPAEKAKKTDLLVVAQAVERAIPGKVTTPSLLGYFPEEGAVPNSARYFLQKVLGQAFLGDGMSVTYRKDETSYRLFLCRFADATSAHEALSKLSQALVGEKSHPNVYSPLPPTSFSVKDRYYGRLLAAPAGRFLVIGVSLPEYSDRASAQRYRHAIGNLHQLYYEVTKQEHHPSEAAKHSADTEEQ